MNWLAKLLFPKHDSQVRRKEMRFFALTLLLALVASAIFGVLVYLLNMQKRF